MKMGIPVQRCGLNLYPITMIHYDIFQNCKDALLLRQATLPVRFLPMDFLSAVFAFDTAIAAETGNATGVFYKIMMLLQLSLRIGCEANAFENAIFCKNKDGMMLLDHINVTQDGKTVSLKPIHFTHHIRPIIAQMNGLVLPDETENLDLVRDAELKKQFYASKSNQKLNMNTESLIASVAYLSNCRERDIFEWSVREFEERRLAIERDKHFMINAQAELSGMVSFKNGNPYPSWCHDLADDSLGTTSLAQLQFGNVSEQKNEK